MIMAGLHLNHESSQVNGFGWVTSTAANHQPGVAANPSKSRVDEYHKQYESHEQSR